MRTRILAVLLLMSSFTVAQMGPPPDHMMGPRENVMHFGPGPMGRWWKNADVVKKLGLTDDQVQRIEKIFQEHRLRLVDLRANLEKAELGLEPLIQSDNPDENAVMAQIDKVTSQRAELEKANAHMLFAIRRVLSAEQWKELQSMKPARPARMSIPGPPPGNGGPGGGPGPKGDPGPGGGSPPPAND